MTYIIAECGVNHNGSIELAKRLIDEACKAGCDAVKFQTFKTENLVTDYAEKANYQKENTGNEESQFEMLKKLELSNEAHIELIEYCNTKKIEFLSTPFDSDSAEFLEKLEIRKYKIGSGEITNKPLLKKIAKFNKPIILSTGMSSLGEVEEALNWLREEGNNDITLLHCTSNYPTRYEDVNLRAMETMKIAFKTEVGYSDHTEGIEIAIAAVSMGSSMIEKHLTLDKNMEGPDHKASLEPREFGEMVRQIRNVEKSIGDGIKRAVEAEKSTRDVARKSIVSKKDIKIGERLTEENLTVKRPGTGMKPSEMDFIVGKIARNEIQKDSIIKMQDIE